jgi:outer membrane protein assembly factor BamD (BamD/ComL family)
MRYLLIAALAGALAAGCSVGRTTHHETTTGDSGSYGTSVSLHKDPDEAMLERGKEAVLEGRFTDGADLYRELADKASAKQEYREAALFELAQLQANPLNPFRNPGKALELFRQFVATYPDSKLADRAKEQISLLGGGD